MSGPLQIGFIPLVDAAALIIAVDKGFPAQEGLDVNLVREVSWSNVREKSISACSMPRICWRRSRSLRLGHRPCQGADRRPLQSRHQRQRHHGVAGAACGDLGRDRGRSLRSPGDRTRVVARGGGAPQAWRGTLTFAMTFPFSTHNYQLRFWMAVGGVDPDEDVRMVVLPPPFMADSLASGQVDAFCVARPGIRSRSTAASATSCISSPISWYARPRRCWRSVKAGRSGIRCRLCPRSRGCARVELCRRESRGDRAHSGAAGTCRCRRRHHPAHPRRALEDFPYGTMRQSGRYLLVGREDAARPDPVQAAWLYAQMARWGQTQLGKDALRSAMAAFRPDLTTPRSARVRARRRRHARPSRPSRDPPSTPRTSRDISPRSTSPNALDQTLGIVIRSLFLRPCASRNGMNYHPVNALRNDNYLI